MLERTYYQESITKEKDRIVTAWIITDKDHNLSAEIKEIASIPVIAGNVNCKGTIALTEQEMWNLYCILESYFEA